MCRDALVFVYKFKNPFSVILILVTVQPAQFDLVPFLNCFFEFYRFLNQAALHSRDRTSFCVSCKFCRLQNTGRT